MQKYIQSLRERRVQKDEDLKKWSYRGVITGKM
jgi:hypothetical protein